jgi:hypothetical protein
MCPEMAIVPRNRRHLGAYRSQSNNRNQCRSGVSVALTASRLFAIKARHAAAQTMRPIATRKTLRSRCAQSGVTTLFLLELEQKTSFGAPIDNLLRHQETGHPFSNIQSAAALSSKTLLAQTVLMRRVHLVSCIKRMMQTFGIIDTATYRLTRSHDFSLRVGISGAWCVPL